MPSLNQNREGLQVNYIGVDVDSVLLVCRKQYGDKRYSVRQFKNTSAGYRQFILRTYREYDVNEPASKL